MLAPPPMSCLPPGRCAVTRGDGRTGEPSATARKVVVPESFAQAIASRSRVSESPHNLYKYPARFAPEFAREAIRAFSKPGDLVLDCFQGGGTSIAEAVALGRRAVGYDISSLACFLARAKTTPLTVHDERRLLVWSSQLGDLNDTAAIAEWMSIDTEDGYYRRNLPANALLFFSNVMFEIKRLKQSRQRRFARLVLLAVGQWALDCKNHVPSIADMRTEYQSQLKERVREFRAYTWQVAKKLGIQHRALEKQRTIVHASSELFGADGRAPKEKASLVITSPPYPGVHMLYHRWQLNGRREMPAPFLLADCRDGDGISYYSLGHRFEEGLVTYYERLKRIFTAVRGCLKPDAIVIQMVAFNRPEWQLPAFMTAMDEAGYDQMIPESSQTLDDGHIWRPVPGRKWYAAMNKQAESGNELVLFHSPKSNI